MLEIGTKAPEFTQETGNKMMVFHIEDAMAVDIAVMGDGENLLG